MKRIMVVGVGPGDGEYLTAQARAAFDMAQAVYVARRHAALVPVEKIRPLEPLSAALAAIRADWQAGRNVAVAVSGDPGLYSMLTMLRCEFGAENINVIPGISALQTLCARLGMPWQNARILSGHGRELSRSALVHAVRTNALTIMFCDASHDPAWCAKALIAGGMENVKIYAGEMLGGEREKISSGAPRDMAEQSFDPMCMALVENINAHPGHVPAGLHDDEFIRGKTPMTKREIRAQVINALQLAPDSVVWDVGAGTGSVSVECALQCPEGRVFAVERDAQALELIRANSGKFDILNMEAVAGSAPDALNGLPAPDKVFLGGTGGESAAILRLVEALNLPVRLVATAVTLESAQLILSELEKSWHNVECVQLAVSRVEKIGNYHMLRAQNPVFIISADWEMTE